MDICILHLYTLSIHTQIASQFPPYNRIYGNNGNQPRLGGDLGANIQKQQMDQYCAFEMGEKNQKIIQNKTYPLKPITKADRTCSV